MSDRLRLMWYALTCPAELVDELLDVVRDYDDLMTLAGKPNRTYKIRFLLGSVSRGKPGSELTRDEGQGDE